MRLAFGVEYVGTNYSGWQSQSNQPTTLSIQTAVDNAIAKIADHPISSTCAGRTDAGVHACGQVIHCEVSVNRDPHAWLFGCNTELPEDVRITWVKPVADNFDARRSATSRHYKYVIYNHKIRPSLLRNYVGWYYCPLDVVKMQNAANSWLGEHDFSSFRGSGCQSISAVREVLQINIERRAELVIIDIIANAFLYHMVRNMVGALIEIGSGRRPMSWALEVLNARCRTKAGITAKPYGLYLVDVNYPLDFEIPSASQGLWFIKQG